MKRGDLVKLFGGAAIGWPVDAAAQQIARVRRIGVLSNGTENDGVSAARIAVFRKALRALGWIEGQNIKFDVRYGGIDRNLLHRYAAELISLAPDVILADGSGVSALKPLTSSIPIVFVTVDDPLGIGIVSSLARPGGNITGFANAPHNTLGSKFLQLLTEIAPHVLRIAVLYQPTSSAGPRLYSAVATAAKSSRLRVTEIPVHSAGNIASVLTTLRKPPQCGLVFTGDTFFTAHRQDIIKSVAANHLPAIYAVQEFPESGGLMSYGASIDDEYQKAASYVDRILRGARPGDLPVQNPTRYELAINLKTARALGLTAQQSLLIEADEVIK